MNLQNKKAITALSIIALVFSVVNNITFFISYEEAEKSVGKYWETYYESSFNITAIGLLITLLNIAPYILLIAYIFKLRGSIAEAFTVPLLFISTAISACIDLTIFEKEALVLNFQDKLNIVVQRIYQHYKGYSSIDEIRDMNIDGVSGRSIWITRKFYKPGCAN